jgi:TetR/AcrR family transcriptional regulator, regulator of biofilm formation and stress response
MPMIPYDVRRELFISAAMQVIRQEGLAKTTTRRIAAQAQAPLGMLHYCFRNKDEVIEGVLRSLHEAGREHIAQSVTTGMGVIEAAGAVLRGFSSWVVETVNDQLTEYELQIWVIRSDRHDGLSNVLYREWIDVVADLLVRAQRGDEPQRDLEGLARMLLALTDGLNLQDRLLQQDEISTMTERAIVLITRSVEAGDFDETHREEPMHVQYG